MVSVERPQPNLYHYLNYRSYLKDMVEYLRERGQFSNRKFAEKVGFKSSAHFRMILAGQRNLTEQSANKIAKGLLLGAADTKFFKALVEFCQAKDSRAEESAYERILNFKKFREIKKTSAEEYEYFSHWYTVALLEGLGTSWRKKSVPDMARSLGITEAKLRDSLDLLKRLGLVEQDPKGGWRRLHDSFETPIETKSLFLRSFHRQMIGKALSSVDEVAPEERHLLGMTIALSQESYEELNRKIFELIREFNVNHSEERNVKSVYQMLFQVFPLLPVEEEP